MLHGLYMCNGGLPVPSAAPAEPDLVGQTLFQIYRTQLIIPQYNSDIWRKNSTETPSITINIPSTCLRKTVHLKTLPQGTQPTWIIPAPNNFIQTNEALQHRRHQLLKSDMAAQRDPRVTVPLTALHWSDQSKRFYRLARRNGPRFSPNTMITPN